MATFDTQLGTVHQPTVFFPPAVHACYCRRCKVTQRSVLPVSQAAAQQQQSTTKEWSQQDTTKALQYQLDRSAKQTPATARQEHRSEEYEKDLVQRQRSAREWITPWLVNLSDIFALRQACGMLMEQSNCAALQTVKARSRSIDTMATLRNSTSGLSAQQQDTALKRLLGQSWQVGTFTFVSAKNTQWQAAHKGKHTAQEQDDQPQVLVIGAFQCREETC